MVPKIKNKIASSFSRYSEVYDQYAKLQKLSSGYLTANIEKNMSAIPAGPVLEIGCGSGMLSEKIIRRIPEREFVLMDISSGMLATCRKRLSDVGLLRDRIQFAEQDGEEISERNRYALIFSGLTLQWFSDLPGSLDKIISSLVPGGVFLCSFLGAGSFVEWRQQCEKSKVPCTLNPLPDFSFVSAELKEKVKSITLSEHRLVLFYPSVYDFFLSLKNTGTGVALSGQKNSPPQMRKLLRTWQSSSAKGVQLTCVVNCLSIIK